MVGVEVVDGVVVVGRRLDGGSVGAGVPWSVGPVVGRRVGSDFDGVEVGVAESVGVGVALGVVGRGTGGVLAVGLVVGVT